MQAQVLRHPLGEASICLRCLVRISKGRKPPSRRPFSQSSSHDGPSAVRALFRREYFSANKIKLLPTSVIQQSILASNAIENQSLALPPEQNVEQVENTPPAETTGSSPTTIIPDLPHRRRKRLKENTVIPPDASSRLSILSTTLLPRSVRRTLSLYLSISKPRLSSLIVLTTAAAYSLYPVPALLLPTTTASPSLSSLTLVFLASGTFLCSASANGLNMLLEPEHDAKMSRTRNRPIVRGLVGKKGALIFAAITGAVGTASLHFGVNPTVAFLGGLNIFLYAGIYTPLKRISVLNTWVGAVVGGIPPLMGWAAAAGQSATGSGEWRELLFSESSIGGWLLAAFLYAWQFPHFNALSWTIRDEYKNAGYRMLAWVNPSMNGRVAFRYALVSFPICGALWWFGITDQGFVITSSVVNAWIVREAWRFWRSGGQKGSARTLFWAGVWHLPVVMVLAMAHKKGLWEGAWRRLNGETLDDEEMEDDEWMDEEEMVREEEEEAGRRMARPVISALA